MPYAQKEDQARAQARYREKMRSAVQTARSQGCADCGETDPVVLVFHHRDPTTKKFTAGKSIPKLMAEIAKCDVVCANCHMRRHNVETVAQQAEPLVVSQDGVGSNPTGLP